MSPRAVRKMAKSTPLDVANIRKLAMALAPINLSWLPRRFQQPLKPMAYSSRRLFLAPVPSTLCSIRGVSGLATGGEPEEEAHHERHGGRH